MGIWYLSDVFVEGAGVAVDGVAADLARPGALVVPFHRRLVLTKNGVAYRVHCTLQCTPIQEKMGMER